MKVGQTVTIKSNKSGHGFEKGQRVKILFIEEESVHGKYVGSMLCGDGDIGTTWWLSSDETEEGQ